MSSYAFLEEWCGYMPADISIFKKALTHRSGKETGNEQLEYLGDAVINLVVADALYNGFPTATEGTLTRTRAKIVCRENLNKTALKMGIQHHLLSNVTLKTNAEDIYGNAFEALVGAVWVDGGYKRAHQFLLKWLIGTDIRQLQHIQTQETDYKSRLLEWGQTQRKNVEFVQLSERYEKQHDCHLFIYIVRIEGKDFCQGAGHSKLEAQQVAARKTFQQVKKKSQ